jgi:hypothetical protein
MAATIKIKNSSTAGAVPTSGQLVQGELAVNVTDRRIFTENASGTVVELGTPSIDDNGNATAITIDSSENVGIGTTNAGVGGLAVSNTTNICFPESSTTALATMFRQANSGALTLNYGYGWSATSNAWASSYGTSTARSTIKLSDGTIGFYTDTASTVAVGTNITPTERMRIDSSGNVGVGLTSPAVKLHVAGDVIVGLNSGSSNILYIGSGGQVSSNGGSSPLAFGINGTEKARIDSSGNLLIGTTTVGGNGGITLAPNADDGAGRITFDRATTTASSIAIVFENANATSGQISYTNTATTYSTSSDYRLKENIAPMTGALATVAQLKPCTYTWKQDGSAGQGFIAHELQDVVPDAVVGDKDATKIQQYEISPAVPATFDDEGNELTPMVEAVMGEREVPLYQGIDTSFLVATLTAAMQEQQAIITALTARIEALEAA